MTVSVPATVAVVVGLFAIVSVVATIVSYFKVSLSQATIATLRDNNKALDERVTILERDSATLKTRNEALVSENSILREALSGRADVTALTLAIEAHHHSVVEWRSEWESQFRASMVEINSRFDKKNRMLSDILRLLGSRREEPASD